MKLLSKKYRAIHAYNQNHFGKAFRCENPKCHYPKYNKRRELIKKPKKFEWACIKQNPTRNKKDYIQLCKSCHVLYDKNDITLKQLAVRVTKINKIIKQIKYHEKRLRKLKALLA